MRKLSAILLTFTILILLSCSDNSANSGTDLPPEETWEVMGDVLFEDGLAVSALWPEDVQANGGFENTNTDTIYFEKKGVKPTWQMCQWASKYDLAGTQPVVGENKSITYANEGKRITRYPDGTLLLDVTTSTEYGHPRQDGEAWPHLLIQQDFKVLPNIGNLEKLHFNMELKLDKCENKMGMGEYNESFHTAQSPFYLIVRNSNPDSEDNGLSIWFGIPCYDYRYPKMTDQEVIQWDLGTSMYIYSVAQVPIWGDIDFNDMKWHRAEGDILPMIKKAVTDMHSKGLFLNTELSDLELTGMNFGWEIPGTFDAALLVKNISLKAVEKEYGK